MKTYGNNLSQFEWIKSNRDYKLMLALLDDTIQLAENHPNLRQRIELQEILKRNMMQRKALLEYGFLNDLRFDK